MTEPWEMTVAELRGKIRNRELSAREAAESFIRRFDAAESRVDAFLRFDRDGALAQAGAVDARLAAGEEAGALAGVPVALKDNFCVAGEPTTCASPMLAEFRPPYDAHVVELLRSAGAVILGKTNMDEFAMGSTTELSAAKVTRNPWDAGRFPGGSSGGSAAAVAARTAAAALGSDTGGSVRQPASLCGVTGMKPTYGRVSRYGLIAFASSLDQIGPLARDARDAAILLDAISAPDRRDSTCVPHPPPNFEKALEGPLPPLRVGVPKEYFGEGLDPEVERLVREGIEALRAVGAEIREVSLPATEYAVAAYYIVAPAEASSNLARFDGAHYGFRAEGAENVNEMFSRTRAEGFGDEVKRRILLGTFVLSAGYYDAYYLKAAKARRLIRRDFDAAFEEVDLLACPTCPFAAQPFGTFDDPLAMYLADAYTIPVNMAGLPAVSVPCGLTAEGLPAGLQLVADAFQDERLLVAAWAYQRETGHHLQFPSL